MVRRIVSFLSTVRQIVRNEQNPKQRLGLLHASIVLAFRPRVFSNVAHGTAPEETVFGYKLKYLNRETLAGMFDEIFVRRVYAFNTSNPAPMIIDCGSNIGLSLLYFRHQYPLGRLIGFEPDAETFALLQDNLAQNNLGDVELHNAAVLDDEGTVDFYSDLDKKNVVGMSTTRRLLEKNLRLKETRVQSTLLSQYLTETVDLLKIDIEGAELKVVRELSRQQKLSLVRRIILEYHFDKTNDDNDLSELLGILEQASYRYVLHGPYPPPYYRYEYKPYNLMIYAYQETG